MKKIREGIKGNKVFLIITVLVMLTAFISFFSDNIGENPFETEYYLENPVQAVYTDNERYYLIDSSYTLIAANSNNELSYIIYGGMPENTFDYADGIAVDGDTIYVHDKSYTDDGSYAYCERILEFTEKGKTRRVLYEQETLGEDGTQIIYLDCPRVIDGEIYFSLISEDGIHINKCVDENVEECAFMPFENAHDVVADSTFSDELVVSAVLMNGDVYTCLNGENKLIYDASENRSEEYCSLITDIAYSGSNLYINDMGHRRIYEILSDGSISTVVDRGHFSGEISDETAKNPLYTGFNVNDGYMTMVSAEYIYYPDTGESDYIYEMCVEKINSGTEFYADVIGISTERRIINFAVYAALIIMAVIAVYSVICILRLVKQSAIQGSNTQILILVTAILITIGVSASIFEVCNERFVTESSNNLSNIAYLIDETIDKNVIKEISSPDAYFEEDYEQLNNDIIGILKSGVNESNNIYAVIYKVYDNIIAEVYRNDMYHGVMYPMAGVYEGSIEESISESGECFVSEAFELSEGSYTFSLVPSYDENGEILAFIEVGTDYNYFAQENNELYKKTLIIAAMAVIIIMLIFGEILNGITAFKAKPKNAASGVKYPPEVIRPIAFMIFFTANITTVFLPIYGMSLWNDSFPLPAEVAAAFPLSAEIIMSAISALICGFVIKKTGIKPMCIIGALFYVGGNALSAFAGNLWILICANSICGIGGGLLTISVNTWIAGFEDEEKQNKGFVHFNAAFLAGMNCGTVVGSILWESFGIFTAYMTAVVCAVLIIILVILLMENKREIIEEKEETNKKGVLKKFVTPGLVKYFICLAIPYLICASFLSYYFPIIAEENMLSASEISMAFLISGVISIYAGTAIGEPVIDKLGTRKSMVLASFIYAVALLYLVINPTISSCYIVIILFSVADSFGLSAQSVYFATMPEVKNIGQSRALGINSTIESITSACGSVIFGAALLLGEQKGIMVITAVFAVLLLIFNIGGKKVEEVNTSENV